MSDMTEWLKEHRHISEKGIDSAARALWGNDDPEGESPNESFEDEPRWSQERYKQAAQVVVCTYYDATGFASLLTAMKKVLELHSELTIYALDDSNGTWVYGENGERRVIRRLCLECTSDEVVELVGDGEWLEGWTDSEEVDWPCGTVRAIEGATNDH